MNSDIIVSVLCIAYNHKPYIEQTLKSILEQKTTFNYELIVHDDASNDGTTDIIKQYQKQYPAIVKPILQTENQYSKGVCIIRDIMLPQSKGKYIAFCEGDDYWSDPEKLQKQVDYLQQHEDYSAVVHNTERYEQTTGKRYSMYHFGENRTLFFKDVVCEGGQSFHFSSVLTRKAVLEDRRPYIDCADKYRDYPFAILYALSGKIHYMDKIMSVYRVVDKNSSWSQQLNSRDIMCRHWSNINEMLETLKEELNSEQIRIVDSVIIKNQYHIFEMRNEYRKLIEEPYLSLYKEHSFQYRFKKFLKRILS